MVERWKSIYDNKKLNYPESLSSIESGNVKYYFCA